MRYPCCCRLRGLVPAVLGLVAAAAFTPARAADARPPNGLSIAVDDPTATVSCMGHPVVKTPNIEGRDLTLLLKNPQAPWDHAALTQTPRKIDGRDIVGYSVRTERWRYTEWGENGAEGRELYDHDNDPREFTNLLHANAAAHEATVRELKARMRRSSVPRARRRAPRTQRDGP